jgi:hypothetical protein
MRSGDSRTVRWTVHVTRREFELLEILRSDWSGRAARQEDVQSRAELLLSLVTWLLEDDPAVASLPRVAQAWQAVLRELWLADDHKRGWRRSNEAERR